MLKLIGISKIIGFSDY